MSNALKDNLDEFKNKVKEKWGDLTDKDSASLNGDVDQLADILQQRLGCAKEQAATAAHEFIKEFEDTCKSGGASMIEGVSQAADEISDISKDVCKKTVEVTKHIKEDMAEFVKHKPYQSIAIAATAGLVFGFLFRKS